MKKKEKKPVSMNILFRLVKDYRYCQLAVIFPLLPTPA